MAEVLLAVGLVLSVKVDGEIVAVSEMGWVFAPARDDQMWVSAEPANCAEYAMVLLVMVVVPAAPEVVIVVGVVGEHD